MYINIGTGASFNQVFTANDQRFPNSIRNQLKQGKYDLMIYFEYNLKNLPKKTREKQFHLMFKNLMHNS